MRPPPGRHPGEQSDTAVEAWQPLKSVDATCRQLRQRYLAARKIRQLKKRRTRTTAGGYSLQGFDRYHCIFVHIPKCAGVSVCRSLFGDFGAGHYPLTTFRKVFSPTDYSDYFKFAFVRNPWDRLFSAYRFLKRGGFNPVDRRWAEQHLAGYHNFGDFVRGWVTPDNVRSWVHFRPQCDYLQVPDGIPGIDFIGRFENLEADFARLCERLGLQRQLETLNTDDSAIQDYTDFYNAETRELVADVYRQDVIGLGYRFGEDRVFPRPGNEPALKKQGE